MTEAGAEFEVTPLRNSNVQYLYSRRHEIDMDPPYQRQSAVWSLEKQQLLIDSLLNGFDVPTIYLHQYARPETREGKTYRYALVDGKQRVEAIFGFLDGAFALSEEFVRIVDGSTAAAGKTYAELKTIDPLMASDLQATTLDVKTIKTSDVELIEDMFSRLNEAVPLNAAEKRNAFGGPLPRITRGLVQHSFFLEKLPFSNLRYRHYDLAAKFLYVTEGADSSTEPADQRAVGWSARDLKKVRLDRFFKSVRDDESARGNAERWSQVCTERLEELCRVFTSNDPLLSSVGMVTVYYMLATERNLAGKGLPLRSDLVGFEEARRVKASVREEALTSADLGFIEFARLAQSPNDESALAYRLKVLDAWLCAKERGDDPRAAVGTLYESAE